MPASRVFSSVAAEMRMLPDFFTGNWDDMFQGLLEAEHLFDFPEPSQAFEEISLHNLFDVELDESEGDPNEEAVDGMFPNWMLSEDHSADSGAASGDSGVGEDLVEVNLDLKCYEEGLPPSGSEADEAEERAEEEETAVSNYVNIAEGASQLVLDCPENPGRGCRACDFHRGSSGNPEAMCALCYMRLTGHCIYSKWRFFFFLFYTAG